MTPIEFVVAAVGFAFGFGAAWWVTQVYALRRPNFRGDMIPAVAGLAFLLGGVFIYAYEWLMQGVWVGSAAAYLLAVFGFGTLGLADDLLGDRSVGGLRGHFRALSRGRLTTGAAKALGGGVISVVIGYLVAYPVWWQMGLAALLVALSANALNLTDTRPGRCLFAFFVGALVLVGTLAWLHALAVGFLLYVAVAFAVILFPLDSLGRMMLGDVGANAFGAVLGVAGALIFSPLWQGVVVAFLLAFHVWTEKHSLSEAIERSPLLRRLDAKIGVR